MSMLLCPLCGKMSSLSHFNPEELDLNIYAVTVRGLGRGRGFETGPWTSVLGDSGVTPMIKDRILDIALMLIKNGDLKPAELLSKLKIKAVSPQEFHKLKGDVEALTAELEEAERERNRWRVEAETHHVKLENLKKQYDMRLKKKEAELEDARRLNTGLKRELSQERGEVETLEVELKEKKEELSGLYEEIGDVVDSIEEALTADGEAWTWAVDEEEEPVEALKERLQDLLNEYESLASEAE